jgi:hypothetical protein
MKIAVIGWGSLIWSERILKVEPGLWHEDGPSLPIEFSRVSTDRRLTLVIDPAFQEIQTYWKVSNLNDLEEAIENLRVREDTPFREDIGFVNVSTGAYQIRDQNQFLKERLMKWGRKKKMEALIWTDLEPIFHERTGMDFSLENVEKFIRSLDEQEWSRAEEYIRRAPVQTQTQLRSAIYEMFT